MIELDILDYLVSLNTPALARVFPIEVPQGAAFPAITVSLSSKDRIQDQQGCTGDETSTFALRCHTEGDRPLQAYTAAKSLINSVVSGVNSYVGEIDGCYAVRIGNENDESFTTLDGAQTIIATISLEIMVYTKG